MAARGSKKEMSVRHESYIAKLFGGRRSRSSGASIMDKGDVRTATLLIECKMRSTIKPTDVMRFEKIAKEAYEDRLVPLLALRYYDPESPLSDANGWIDFVLGLAGDIALWEQGYNES